MASGSTYINAGTGQLVGIRNNNGDIATFSGTNISFSRSLSVVGGITGDTNVNINRDGSNSVGAGGHYRLTSVTDPTQTVIQQLSADGHFDTWIYDTQWRRRLRLVDNGNFLIGNNAVDNGVDLAQFGDNLDISVAIGRGRLGFATGRATDRDWET